MNKIKIVFGDIEMSCDRDSLVEVKPVYDGIAFQFRNGLYLEHQDQSMPVETKNMMKITLDKMKGNITFRLEPQYYNKPALLEA